MLNKDFILQKIKLRLSSLNELYWFDFFDLFGPLTKVEQYEVIRIAIENDIELIDEKEEDIAKLDAIDSTQKIVDDSYKDLLDLSNEILCVLAQEGDQRATSALIIKNKRFIYQLAQRLHGQYQPPELTIDDCIQEGILGMLESIRKFDASKGHMFLTYSWSWVRQRITREIMNSGYMIRLPVHVFEKAIRICRYRKHYFNCDLLEFTQTVISAEREKGNIITAEEILFYIKLSENYLNVRSLSELIGENQDTELFEFLPTDEISIEDQVLNDILRDTFCDILDTLTPREKDIIRKRFGFDGKGIQTLEAISDEYHLTRERIRQIEAKALRKLKHISRRRKLEPFSAGGIPL